MRNSAAAHAGVDLLNSIIWDGSGVDCKFFKLSDTVGLKTYINGSICVNSYYIQHKLSRKGLAPKCWGLSQKNGVYCFFTEIAEVMHTRLKKFGKVKGNKWADDEHNHNRLSRKFEPVIRKMVEDSTDFYVCDVHIENVGMLNGRLVVIDVGYFRKK